MVCLPIPPLPQCSNFKDESKSLFCTEGRTRTGTGLTSLRILSPVRLPIPPLRPYYCGIVERIAGETCRSFVRPLDLSTTQQSFEAPIRFELMHKGFADLSLTTWVRRQTKIPSDGRDGLLGLSGKRDSNPRHQPWQGCALPTELLPRITSTNIMNCSP